MSPLILEIQIVSSGISYIYSSSYCFYPFLGRRKVSKFAQWSGKTHIFMISCPRQVVCRGSTTIFQINSGTSTFHWHIEPSSDCGLLHRKKSLLCQEEKIPSPKGSYCWNGFRWPSPGVASKWNLFIINPQLLHFIYDFWREWCMLSSSYLSSIISSHYSMLINGMCLVIKHIYTCVDSSQALLFLEFSQDINALKLNVFTGVLSMDKCMSIEIQKAC